MAGPIRRWLSRGQARIGAARIRRLICGVRPWISAAPPAAASLPIGLGVFISAWITGLGITAAAGITIVLGVGTVFRVSIMF
ncbi:MAG TPA: hypothetical protein VIJ82_22620 [Streptosporangiaceae bacterium]